MVSVKGFVSERLLRIQFFSLIRVLG